MSKKMKKSLFLALVTVMCVLGLIQCIASTGYFDRIK